MKLYDSRRAPNPRRVRWVMAEKGIEDIEVVDIDIFKGTHKEPEFRAKFGFSNIPALELDDGTGITESVAIARYLETIYPEPNLFGRDPKETAVIEMWTRRTEMNLATPCMTACASATRRWPAIETPDPAFAERSTRQAHGFLKVLDRRLGESAFIAADRITIADILAYTGMDFARMVKFEPDPSLTNVLRWQGRHAGATGGQSSRSERENVDPLIVTLGLDRASYSSGSTPCARAHFPPALNRCRRM
jgi:glutathione S-transferase